MLMRSVLLLACLLGLVVPAASQTPLVVRVVTTCGTVPTTYIAGSNNPAVQDINGNFCTSASVSASISGFAPATTGTPISVTASAGGVTGTLPAGAVVVASNVGTTNIAYCKLGATSTTSDQPIAPNGGWFAFTVGAATQLTCITSTSTTTVNMVGGSGLPTGTGGGGGGSGGAITMASAAVSSGAYASGSIAAGAMVDFLTTRGTKAPGTAAANSLLTGCVYTAAGITLTDGQQAACQMTSAGSIHVTADASALPSGAATAANQATEIASLATIASNTGAPVPLGSSSGGITPLKLDALTNTAVAIKAAAGQLYKLYCYNPNSSVSYIQVYNVAAGSVTVGVTAALQSYGIPATSAGGFALSLVGDQYSTAISAAATTTAGGGSAPSTAVDCNVGYQ
jgi:hypothetical protein